MGDVVVLIGSGSLGQAIAGRASAASQLMLADWKRANADAVARVLKDAG